MHIMEGFFAADVGAGVVAAVFLPCLWYGLVRLRRIVQEESNQEGAAGPLRGVYFCSFGAEDPVGDRQLLASDRRRSGGDPLRAGRGGGAGGDRSAVPGAAAGAWRPDHPWRQRDVDGGDRPDGRLSGVEAGLSGGIRRDVGVFLCAMLADLMTYFVTSVQLGVAFPDPATGAGGSIAKFMGIFCLTQIPIAIAEGLLTVMIYDQLTKRRLIAAEGH